MSVDEENISRILSVLSHRLRREILLNLSQKSELSFTDLMNSLNVDTGKLSFHIRGLVGFIEQTPKGKYRLTKSGENALRLIRELETWAIEAEVARSDVMLSLAPLRRRTYAFMIDFSIVFSVFATATIMSNLFSFFAGGGVFRVDLNVIFFVIVFWVYCTLLEGFAGQTVGKRIIGLVVVRVDRKRLTYDQTAVRNLGKIFLVLPFDMLVGNRLRDKRYARYFDKFAGTTVIDTRL